MLVRLGAQRCPTARGRAPTSGPRRSDASIGRSGRDALDLPDGSRRRDRPARRSARGRAGRSVGPARTVRRRPDRRGAGPRRRAAARDLAAASDRRTGRSPRRGRGWPVTPRRSRTLVSTSTASSNRSTASRPRSAIAPDIVESVDAAILSAVADAADGIAPLTDVRDDGRPGAATPRDDRRGARRSRPPRASSTDSSPTGAWSVTAPASALPGRTRSRPARTRRCSTRWPGSNGRSPSPPRRRSPRQPAPPPARPTGSASSNGRGRIVVLEPDLAYATTTYDEITATARSPSPRPRRSPRRRFATRPGRAASTSWPSSRTSTGAAILRRTPAGHVPGPRARTIGRDRAMTARRVTGVVLAGGRSSRFGRDKLAERDRWPDPPRPTPSTASPRPRPRSSSSPPRTPARTCPLARRSSTTRSPSRARSPASRPVFAPPTNRSSSSSAATCRRSSAPSSTRCWRRSTRPASTRSSSSTTAEPGRCPIALRRDPALAAADRLLADGERRLRALTEALDDHGHPGGDVARPRPLRHDGPRHRHARRPGLTADTRRPPPGGDGGRRGVLEGGLREEGQPP